MIHASATWTVLAAHSKNGFSLKEIGTEFHLVVEPTTGGYHKQRKINKDYDNENPKTPAQLDVRNACGPNF